MPLPLSPSRARQPWRSACLQIIGWSLHCIPLISEAGTWQGLLCPLWGDLGQVISPF